MFYWQVRFQTTSLYGHSQTWLETKFHVANSRTQVLVNNGILILPPYVSFIVKLGLKDLVHNGILILPHYVSFIEKLGLKRPLIFTGQAKNGGRQNFM